MIIRVLIVDDEPYVVESLVAHLKEACSTLDVYTAYRAGRAMAIMEKARIDLLITDIRMPDMTGLELLDVVNRQWPLCKTMILTGFSHFDYAYEAIQKRACGFILKSERTSVLLEKITRVLDNIRTDMDLRAQLESARNRAVSVVVPAEVMRLCFTHDAMQERMLSAYHFTRQNAPLLLVHGTVASPRVTQEEASSLDHILRHYLGGILRHDVFSLPAENEILWLCELDGVLPATAWLNGTLESMQASARVSMGLNISLIAQAAAHASVLPAVYKNIMRLHREMSPGDIPYVYTPDQKVSDDCGRKHVVSFLRRYIDGHLDGDISLMQLSDVSGYNPDYLSRMFRQDTQTTISRYISSRKLQLIASLMLEESHTIEEIARKTGFSSRSYFNRFVRKETGMSPNEYRATLQEAAGEGDPKGDMDE